MKRNFGGKLTRLGTPIEKTYHGSVQSPSNNKTDIMILPGVTLQESENNKKLLDVRGFDKKDLRKKSNTNSRTDGTGAHEKKVQKLVASMNQPRKEYVDYLTPMRKEREFAIKNAGNNTINW